jgi:hypothetical protein
MPFFQYRGIVIAKQEVLELRGVCVSRDVTTAQTELASCGLKVVEISEATAEDMKIHKLKMMKGKLQQKMQPLPITQILPSKNWWQKLLFWRR